MNTHTHGVKHLAQTCACVSSCRTWPCYFAKRACPRDLGLVVAVLWIGIVCNTYPDPAFYLNADPDPGSKTNADPDSVLVRQKNGSFTTRTAKWMMIHADPDLRGSESTTVLVGTVRYRYWNFQHQHYSKPWRFTLWLWNRSLDE